MDKVGLCDERGGGRQGEGKPKPSAHLEREEGGRRAGDKGEAGNKPRRRLRPFFQTITH